MVQMLLIAIMQIGKLRLRHTESVPQGHTAIKSSAGIQILVNLIPEQRPLTVML